MRVLFLDIDGVLNSFKTCLAYGGYPLGTKPDQRPLFDDASVKLLQRFCDSSGVQIVLSSSWRILSDYKDVGELLELPIIDATPKYTELGSKRGHQIKEWLDAHPEVEQYAIIDDDSDMLEDQKPFFVHTDGKEGMAWKDFVKLCHIFKESEFSGEPRQN